MKINNHFRSFLRKYCPDLFMRIHFYKRLKYFPSMGNPKTINEILSTLKKHSLSDYGCFADKLVARHYIENKIKKYNIKNLYFPNIYYHTDNASLLGTKLPDRESFIKPNHASGMYLRYSPTKRTGGFSTHELEEMRKWLEIDYGFLTGQNEYRSIPRKIFYEEALLCETGMLPDDIKIHCFHGKPVIIQIIRRTSGTLERKTYNSQWVEVKWFKNECLDVNTSVLPKNDILDNAIKLSEGFNYCRVDFYLVDNKLYFGELTFHPADGMLPLSSYNVDVYLGKVYLDINNSLEPAGLDSFRDCL